MALVLADVRINQMRIFIVVLILVVILSAIGIVAARRSWVFGRLTCLTMLIFLSIWSLFFEMPSSRLYAEQIHVREISKDFLDGMKVGESKVLQMQLTTLVCILGLAAFALGGTARKQKPRSKATDTHGSARQDKQ